MNWNLDFINKTVKKYQNDIAEAYVNKDLKKVSKLQEELIMSIEGRQLAVWKVINNSGAKTPGIDGEKPKDARKSDTWLELIVEKLLDQEGYIAKPVRRIYIPKANGSKRPLGIPTFYDRCMQALHSLTLAPISEAWADEGSFGFRPGRSQQDALKLTWMSLNSTRKYSERTKSYYYIPKFHPRFIIDADIKGFFDNIGHNWILENIPINKLVLKQFLDAGYIDIKKWYSTESGVPQGGVISPMISNMVLDGLSNHLKQTCVKNKVDYKISIIRYADDFIVIFPFKRMGPILLKAIKQFLAVRGLTLNEEKTKIIDILENKDGFKFLGTQVYRPRRTLKSFQNKETLKLLSSKNITEWDKHLLIVRPHPDKVVNFRKELKKLIMNNVYVDIDELIKLINPKLRGWYNYYKYSNSTNVFRSIDLSIWRYVVRWAQKKHNTKSSKFIYKKYTHVYNNQKYFGYWDKKRFIKLFNMGDAGIRYHSEVCKNHNYYLLKHSNYFKYRNMK